MKQFVEDIQHQDNGRYKIRVPWIEERVPHNSNEAKSREYSISECMKHGPPTQPYLWSIFIRSRLTPVCIVGDMEKAFLQVELEGSNREAFRFIYKPRNIPEQHYRFYRVPFGGESFPFMLGGVFKYHLETSERDGSVKEKLKENI